MARLVRLALALLVLSTVAPAHAATFTVDAADDGPDAAPGDGVCATAGGPDSPAHCTLRAAIQEANASPGADDIAVPAGTYVLSRTAEPETTPADSGDLNLTGDVAIAGAGAGLTSIFQLVDGQRIFDVAAGVAAHLSGITLQGLQNPVDQGGLVRTAGALRLTGCILTDGRAQDAGGGIAQVDGTLVLEDTQVVSNGADGQGGGIAAVAGTSLSVTGGTIAENSAGGGGGGEGGGVYTHVPATFDHASVVGNTDEFDRGGGIFADAGTLTLLDSTVATNTSGDDGAGIAAVDAATVVVERCTFAENHADESTGGGAWLEVPATFTNATFSDNTADAGAALGVDGSLADVPFSVVLTHVTATRNVAGSSPGGLETFATDVVLANSIVADNGATDGPADCDSDVIRSLGGNVLGTSCDDPIAGPGDVVTDDPQLDALADAGGPTHTRVPLAGSPAIDLGVASNCAGIATDQRGNPRFQGTSCDAGAVETDGPLPTTTTTTTTTSTTRQDGTSTTSVPATTTTAPIASTTTLPACAASPSFAGLLCRLDGFAGVVAGLGPGKPAGSVATRLAKARTGLAAAAAACGGGDAKHAVRAVRGAERQLKAAAATTASHKSRKVLGVERAGTWQSTLRALQAEAAALRKAGCR